MAEEMQNGQAATAVSGDWFGSVLDFGVGVADRYFAHENAGSNPSTYPQQPPAVTPGGKPIQGQTAGQWVGTNWLGMLLAAALLLLVLILVKRVL